MCQSTKAITYAIALTLVASPFAVANPNQPQVFVSHIPKPIKPAHKAAARCVKAIQQH